MRITPAIWKPLLSVKTLNKGLHIAGVILILTQALLESLSKSSLKLLHGTLTSYTCGNGQAIVTAIGVVMATIGLTPRFEGLTFKHSTNPSLLRGLL